MEPQEKIFQLYIQRLSGNLTPDEESHVQHMLAEDEAFRETWDALESKGRSIGAGQYAHSLNPAEGLQDLHIRKLARRRNIRTNLAIAASLLLLVMAGTFWITQRQPVSLQQFIVQTEQQKQSIQLTTANGQSVTLNTDSSQNIQLSNTTLTTGNGSLNYVSSGADTALNVLAVPAGEQYRLVLSDGTEVFLNASTRLRFPFQFGQGNREVTVEGEAFFKVAKDPSRRFIVHTPNTQVQVYGTSFNVNTYQAQEKTSLVEGSVWMQAADGQRSELKPGFQAQFQNGKTGKSPKQQNTTTANNNKFNIQSFDQEEVLAWMKGIYYFHKMPVTELAKEASRFYGVKFILESDKFAGIATTGLMDRNKLSEFLTDLQVTAGAEFRFENKAIYLK